MLDLSASQVQSLAPDAAAAAAGKKLAKPAPWKNLGHSADAIWGECQGSALYQTRVARRDLVAKCSCPSRKFPCKHALGLLLLAVDSPGAFPESAAPEWVSSWLDKRDATAQKKEERAVAAAAKPVDEEAQARRSEKRHEKIRAGVDQLDAWLRDLIRQGLASAQAQPPSFWDAQSRRLVDAQAPGLASKIRQLASRSGQGEARAARLLDDLGGLALLLHAYRRLDRLAAPLVADVQRLIGLTLERDAVIEHGDVVEDQWSVLGDFVDDDERVRAQRIWLRGERSGRSALVLQFAAAGAGFAEALVVGSSLPARLAFWPSACPQRALIAERHGAASSVAHAPPGDGVAQALAQFADRIAQLPWLERDVFVLRSVVPVSGERVQVLDSAGAALELVAGDHDLLFAWSGGHPLTLIGEWDGYELLPLAVFQGRRVLALSRSAA